jgi:hypothetical protein
MNSSNILLPLNPLVFRGAACHNGRIFAKNLSLDRGRRSRHSIDSFAATHFDNLGIKESLDQA